MLPQKFWALRAGRGLFPRTGTLGSPQATLRPVLPLTGSGLLREAFLWWPDSPSVVPTAPVWGSQSPRQCLD